MIYYIFLILLLLPGVSQGNVKNLRIKSASIHNETIFLVVSNDNTDEIRIYEKHKKINLLSYQDKLNAYEINALFPLSRSETLAILAQSGAGGVLSRKLFYKPNIFQIF